MTKVNLRGIFGTIHPGPLSFDVSTPAELLHALCTLIPKFRQALKCSNIIFMADKKNIHFNEFQMKMDMNIVDIVPSASGAKSIAGFIEAAVGAAIIGASIFFQPELAPWIVNIGIGFGASLVAGGVVGLLFPTPKMPNGGNGIDPNASTLFTGPQNIAQYGGPIPVGFGKFRCGSLLASEQLKVGDTVVV